MEQNMTALVSLFARAYHQKNKDIKIFDDPLSTKFKPFTILCTWLVSKAHRDYFPYCPEH